MGTSRAGPPGDFLGELAFELVKALERRREIGANAHEIVFSNTLRAQDAAFGIQQLVGHMQTHNLVAHAGIVAHRMRAVHGDNRPCHHTVFNTCGEHTAMIGTQRAIISE